jgi:predicted ATPase
MIGWERMARIRQIEIRNFRCIQELSWKPSAGINCLIGPGDSGKSAILDAIDLCLGARRSLQITDADFYRLNVETPIVIEVTIGELEDNLKNLDVYGSFLRGFTKAGEIEDEPEQAAETVLTLRLTIGSDLEPVWTLVSDRAEAEGFSRYLTWADRTRLSPTRIGALADYNLSWRRGSVLNQLSEDKPDVSASLARAAREARASFGEQAEQQLGGTLEIVERTAAALGIPLGGKPKAMLDAHSVSFTGGTISLHDVDGVPLRGLGLGSTRLLVAGLQREAAKEYSVLLIDELEHGLEPHRIIRLLGSIGSKESSPPLQGFVTTHSPVALRELSGDQLFVVRKKGSKHAIMQVGTADGIQGAIRLYPEAFLASTVVVCEGASEVGLLRGLDLYFTSEGSISLNALGVALVDAGGCDKIYGRANAFATLGYRTAVVRDSDVLPDATVEAAFVAGGGKLVAWRSGRALEDELFGSLPDAAALLLIERAIEIHGEEQIEANLSSQSAGALALADCEAPLPQDFRTILGKASRSKKNGWFKSVGWMEDVARDVVAPALSGADPAFGNHFPDLFEWMSNGGK